MASYRSRTNTSSRNQQQFEANENESENPANPVPFPHQRSPLNLIQDPSQCVGNEYDSRFRPERLGRFFPEKKNEALDYYGTPRAVQGKSHSEPNSAQSTPVRSISRVSNLGSSVGCVSYRPPHHTGTKGGNFSRVSRAISAAAGAATPWPAVEVPHFELLEDSSFWMDHNVQVLIRIRPISSMERTLQGYTSCLRQENAQTLTWLGHPETRFTFDHIACETISQEKLFRVAGLPMVENCMSGYNSCMFAYGQTGSGKTYTMMGEIREIDDSLSVDCGMTPRIFEYLFMRIRAEEENRRDERLKYSCKCSFIEIYNEQITDLLEPSSTNLQLREDMKKGVYVENLKEFEVINVKDVVRLLLQGAANRKVAATYMNSESSRSHSVFTCIVESRWEKDSMTHFRFGRLNLVDLAGSERQKSSGAEGERLKEAANINKSLSTLGLVIMTLVDVAHGKHRHVPYRDSRLTFLLQDSLGGNSKTTIIANVSPSICSANETLSTLKFAQRAKLIQNNAKVNEDASGDVIALQQQIHQLKAQLTFLLKHQNVSRPLSCPSPYFKQANLHNFDEEQTTFLEENVSDAFHNLNVSNKKVKNLEAALVGALRREKMAEAAVRRLEAEIEHMSRLVNQREEDAQRTKMLLRFREEKIRRLNLLPDGLISADEFLMEENVALSEEIHMLQEKIDRHPELTRFALENIRLLEQLRMFQDFYEQGQRETLLDEISNLRDQILEILNDGQAKLSSSSASEAETKLKQAAFSAVQGGEMLHTKADNTLGELEECKKHLASCLEANTKLTSEVDDLRHQLNFFLNSRETNCDKNEQYSFSDHPKKEANELSSVELTLARMNSEERLSSCKEVREKLLKIQKDHMDAAILEPRDAQKELLDVKYLVEAMESQQIHLIEELDNLKQKNYQYLKLLRSMGHGDCKLLVSQGKMGKLGNQEAEQMVECGDMTKLALQTKLLLLHSDLVEAKILNRQYKDDQASQLLNHHELEQVQEEVEVETAKTIIYLQGELAALQQEVDSKNTNESSAMRHSLLLRTENQELQERLCTVARENIQLKNAIAVKEDEIKALTSEWEKATFDLTDFLVDGIQSLEDASYQSEGIVNLFSQRKPWIGERVERAVRVFIEKEQTIEQLQKKLEAAQKMGMEMKLKLNSLKGATIAITEVQQLEKNENFKEVNQLRTLLSDKLFTIHELEGKLENMEQQMTSAENRANAAFIAIKRPYEMNDFKPAQRNVTEVLMNVHSTESLRKNDSNRSMESKFSEPTPHVYSLINHVDEENCDLKFVSSLEQDRSQNIYVDTSSHALGEIGAEVEMARRSVMESENAICTSYVDTEKYLSALLSDILDTSSEVRQMVQDLINDVCNMKKKFMKLKEQNKRISCLAPESPSSEVCETRKIKNEYSMACLLRSAIIKTNEKLDIIRVSIDTLCNVHGCSIKVGDPTVAGFDLLACRFCKRSCSQPEHAAFYSDHGLERKTKSVSSVDYCISAFDHSPIEKDSEYEMGESFSSISSIGYSRRLEEQNWDIFTQRDLACACSGHDMAESQLPLGDSFCNDTDALYLREEVESAISSLMRIYRHLCKLLVNKGVATHSFPEKMDICESLECGTDDHQLNTDNKEEFNQLAIPEVGLILQKLEQRMEEAEVGCCEAREICLKLSDARLVAEEKIKQTNNLLLKYEEAQETMKEADLMINKLLRVNENAKNKTNGLKEACKELMTEKASLIEEVQWLKASMQLKDEQSESLQDQFLMVLVEVAESMSSLEGAFLQMWKNLEEELKLLYSEFFNLRQELLDSIGTSRTWLEYIWSEAMEKGFSWFVLYQCHIGAFLEKLASFNSDSSFSKYRHNESGSAHGNVGNICMNAEIDDLKLIQMNEAEKVVNRKLLPHGLSVSVHAEQTLHASQTVQNLVGSLMNSAFVSYEKPDLQLGLKYFWERFVKLEEEKLALSHDMNSVKEIVTEQLVFLESFCPELTSLKEISGSEESDHLVGRLKPEIGATVAKALHSNGSISPDTNCSSVSKVFGFPSFRTQNPVTGLVVEDNEVTETELGGETIDRNTLFAGIQNLKALCAQMLSLVAEKKGCSELAPWHKQDMHAASNDLDNCMLEYVQEREVGHLNCPQMRTECGHNLIQEMKKFIYMISYLKDYTHSGTAKRFGASFLELFQGLCCIEEQVCGFLGNSSEVKVDQTDLLLENLSLKRELARKEYLLEGLLFDVRLLQESTSNIKDIKDESEEMVAALSKIQHELVIKTNDLDDILVQHRELEVRLAERETALSTTRSELEQATEALDLLSNDNNDLRILLEDLYVKKTNVEEQLEEKAKVVKGLEKEILCLTNSVEERVHTSVAEVDDKLRSVSDERDLLHAEIVSLNEKNEMANALADENEAIAVEARQVSEANKIYAEQKEEEVKILEHSIEELESTINVLERKVYEMGEEVERHRVMREDLELELQALRERVLTVKNATENNPAIEEVIEDQMSRKIDDRILELLEAKKYIKVLENDKADQAKEIKQCKEYISELLLHAEAQASQYQQKYKTLEAMVREAKTDLSTSNPSTSTLRTDKSSIKPRGSGSPFKCIASLVQQMNSEKDQELSVARQRIEKLEGLAATRQKEVCMLNARLLATESMTHDVIRDLLGVKLDMTNYANLIDQQHIQKLAEKAQHRTEECQTKEQEIVRLRKQINDLTEERESWIEEIKQRQAYILATQVTVEQLQQRDQLLTMQNEMLKMDKTNLKKKVAELDEMVKKLFGSQGIKNCAHEPTKIKESNFFRVGNEEFAKRLAHSEKLLSHVNRELSWYRKSNGKDPYIKTDANDRLNSKEKDAEFDRGLSS